MFSSSLSVFVSVSMWVGTDYPKPELACQPMAMIFSIKPGQRLGRLTTVDTPGGRMLRVTFNGRIYHAYSIKVIGPESICDVWARQGKTKPGIEIFKRIQFRLKAGSD